MAECLDLFIELMCEGQSGQGEPSPPGFFQRNAHIFDEMFDEESRIEIAGQHPGRQMIERPTGCGAAANGLQHSIEIESRLSAIQQTLADADHRARDDDLVAEFGMFTVLEMAPDTKG